MSSQNDALLADDDFTDEDEYREEINIQVDKGQIPVRIDKLLIDRIERVSRNRIQKAAKAGSVFVNGVAVKPNHKVKPFDQITLVLPRIKHYDAPIPQDIPLDILYEDEDVLVINKQAGLVVHPGVGNHDGTLINALVYHFNNLPENTDNRPGLVHRLDKDTSGIMIIAKTEEAMTSLAKQFFDRTIEREYVSLVWGNVEQDVGFVEGYMARHKRDRMLMHLYENELDGKYSKTHYKVLERFLYTTLIACKLETGRTHQIRVHMQSLKHPVFNDLRYGGDKIAFGTIYTKYKQFVNNAFELCPRQALHARTLGFTHPTSLQWMQFETPLPADMQNLIDKWRKYASALQSEE